MPPFVLSLPDNILLFLVWLHFNQRQPPGVPSNLWLLLTVESMLVVVLRTPYVVSPAVTEWPVSLGRCWQCWSSLFGHHAFLLVITGISNCVTGFVGAACRFSRFVWQITPLHFCSVDASLQLDHTPNLYHTQACVLCHRWLEPHFLFQLIFWDLVLFLGCWRWMPGSPTELNPQIFKGLCLFILGHLSLFTLSLVITADYV